MQFSELCKLIIFFVFNGDKNNFVGRNVMGFQYSNIHSVNISLVTENRINADLAIIFIEDVHSTF